MNIQLWAENLTKEIYSEYKNKYSSWKHGFKVFYSPVVINPALLIISYQPGGTEINFKEEDKDAFEKGNFSLQDFNSYSETNHTMSRRVRSLFDFEGGLKLLRASVVLPLIFFRAPTIQAWRKNLSKERRLAMEEFSSSKVKEVIEILKPQRILILGFGTYDQLKEILVSVKKESILYTRKDNNGRMAVSAELGGIQVFAIVHPSGARINKKDWETLKILFKDNLTR